MTKFVSIKQVIPAALLAVFVAGAAHAGEETEVPATPSTQSREAVRADLKNWKAAGLDALSHGEQTPDIASAAYTEAQRHYLALKGQGGAALAAR